MKADLHSHTTYSDGKYTVDELIAIAISRGIDILAITDHDSFEGVKEATSKPRNIKIIVGIELSTFFNEESVHILGYFKDKSMIDNMQSALDTQIENRRARALLVVEKLKEHFDIDLDMQFFEDLDSITRGSIAREIIRQGYPYTNLEIFKHILGDGCPAYLPASKLSTQEGIALIKQSGGLAVLAHPANLKRNRPEDFIALGIDGIEAVYPRREREEQQFRALARKHNLFITGGTDFHLFDDGQHGNIGDVYLTKKDLEVFLQVLYER